MCASIRRRRSALLLALAIVSMNVPAVAQETGKIEGRVTGDAGQPIAGAQVLILGTRLGNITDRAGRYFINNVPAGIQDVEALALGFRRMTVRQQRVLAGQTIALDFRLAEQAVALEPLEVLGERVLLVPRDQIATKNVLTGEEIDRLPVDDPRGLLTLQPGVVETNRIKGISVRGGRSGEEAVYLDGVLIRNFGRGGSIGERSLLVGTNALAEADVITGGFSAQFGDARSGIINYATRSGGRSWTGAGSLATDEPFPKKVSTGTNRVELSLGGPLAGGLSLFAALTAQGSRYANTGKRYRDVPLYYIDGVDTTVTVPVADGEQTVIVPRYARYDGHGRVPNSNNDRFTFAGKIDYSFGAGSRLFISHEASRNQRRLLFGTGGTDGFYNPARYMGERTSSYAWTVGWTQTFFRNPRQSLSLDVKAALTGDRILQGVLDPAWEVSHRDPFAGFTFADMQFQVQDRCDGRSSCVAAPLDEHLLWMLQHDLPQDTLGTLAPYDREVTVRLQQPYRLNPYATAWGYWTTGGVGPYYFLRENNRQLRLALDWQAGAHHRVKLGGDYTDIDTRQLAYGVTYNAPNTAYIERPKRASLFTQDRIDLGDLVVEAGLRLDRFDPNSIYPTLLGFFAPDVPHATFHAAALTALSPRLGVSFPVTAASTFRLSYGHFVQVPDLGVEYWGKNQSYDGSGIFPRPLQFPRTVALEFGFRQLLGPDLVLDIAAYNRDSRGDLSQRSLSWKDPTNPGRTVYLPSATNADFGTTRGVDVRFDRRIGRVARAMVAYAYVNARNTGSDPLSFARLEQGSEINAYLVLGIVPSPPETIRLTEESRTHNITGTLSLTLPRDESSVPPFLRDLAAQATGRFASGLPYTRLNNVGNAFVTGPPLNGVIGTLADHELQTGRTPWIQSLDMRLSRGLRIRRTSAQVFAEVRNLLDFTNRNAVFLTTGGISDPVAFDRSTTALMVSAGGGFVREIDLRSLKAAATVGNAVDLIALRRAEALFGNGDALFTLDEQRAAFMAATLDNTQVLNLVGPGRRMRIGVDFTF